MEDTSRFDSFELQFTPVAQSFYRETAKWARFLAIVGFVFIGLYILWALMILALGGAAFSAAQGMGAMGAVGGTFVGIIILVVGILMFFPTLYLYRFGTKAKQALESSNTEYLTTSLENLKSYFKFLGIMVAIYLAFVVLMFFFALLGGLAAAM